METYTLLPCKHCGAIPAQPVQEIIEGKTSFVIRCLCGNAIGKPTVEQVVNYWNRFGKA